MGTGLRKTREIERREGWADEPSKQRCPQKSGCRTRDVGSYVSRLDLSSNTRRDAGASLVPQASSL
jgi:hypothetical protein